MTKPLWAKASAQARSLIKLADDKVQLANALRCHETDSTGARCTADAWPVHEHRISDEDRP